MSPQRALSAAPARRALQPRFAWITVVCIPRETAAGVNRAIRLVRSIAAFPFLLDLLDRDREGRLAI